MISGGMYSATHAVFYAIIGMMSCALMATSAAMSAATLIGTSRRR